MRPLYEEANLVIVPTLASAGTNVKVLEAMAMERAVVSTSSGCAGLDLEHGKTVWVADGAEGFAAGVRRLIADAALRAEIATCGSQTGRAAVRLAGAGRRAAGACGPNFWARLPCARLSRGTRRRSRPSRRHPRRRAVWEPASYLAQRCLVAESGGRIAGFLAYRPTGEGEWEILNLAVAPEARRTGVATALAQEMLARSKERFFLEVRLSNTAARQLYEKLGFSQVGLRRGYYQFPPGRRYCHGDSIVLRSQWKPWE